jgi:hypothetical protein
MDQTILDILEKKVSRLNYWDPGDRNDLQVIHLIPKTGQLITETERKLCLDFISSQLSSTSEVSESMPGGGNFSILIKLPVADKESLAKLDLLRDSFKKTT